MDQLTLNRQKVLDLDFDGLVLDSPRARKVVDIDGQQAEQVNMV